MGEGFSCIQIDLHINRCVRSLNFCKLRLHFIDILHVKIAHWCTLRIVGPVFIHVYLVHAAIVLLHRWWYLLRLNLHHLIIILLLHIVAFKLRISRRYHRKRLMLSILFDVNTAAWLLSQKVRRNHPISFLLCGSNCVLEHRICNVLPLIISPGWSPILCGACRLNYLLLKTTVWRVYERRVFASFILLNIWHNKRGGRWSLFLSRVSCRLRLSYIKRLKNVC